MSKYSITKNIIKYSIIFLWKFLFKIFQIDFYYVNIITHIIILNQLINQFIIFTYPVIWVEQLSLNCGLSSPPPPFITRSQNIRFSLPFFLIILFSPPTHLFIIFRLVLLGDADILEINNTTVLNIEEYPTLQYVRRL